MLRVVAPTTWLATAGSGDALAGVLGALLATHAEATAHSELVRVAAAAAVVHGAAGHRASRGGPITVLDLCEALPTVVADLVS